MRRLTDAEVGLEEAPARLSDADVGLAPEVNAPATVSRGTPFQPGMRDITAPEALVRAGKAFAGRASEYAGAPLVGMADLIARAQAALTGGPLPDYAGMVDRGLGVADARGFADAQGIQPGERTDRFGNAVIPAGGEFGKMVPEMVQGAAAAYRLPFRAAQAATPYVNAAVDFARGAVAGAPTATRAGREKAEQLQAGGASPVEAGIGGAATSAMTLAQFGAPAAGPASAATLPARVAQRAVTGGALGASANAAQTDLENRIAASVAPDATQLQVDPFSAEVLAMGAIPGAVMGQMAGRVSRLPVRADLGYGPPRPDLTIVPPEPRPEPPAPVRPPLELVRDDAPVLPEPKPDVSDPAGRVPVAPDWELQSGAPRAVRREVGEPPLSIGEVPLVQLVTRAMQEQPEARVADGIGRTVQDVAADSGVPYRVEPRVVAEQFQPPDNAPSARTAARVQAETDAMRPNVPMNILKTLDTVARESGLERRVEPRVVALEGDAGPAPAARTAPQQTPQGGLELPPRQPPEAPPAAPVEAKPPEAPRADVVDDGPPPAPPKPRSLIGRIRQLGGIDLAEIRDITGEDRAGKRGSKGGPPPGLFRRNGTTLDNLATQLRDDGWRIDTNETDGGVQQLRDMIRDELDAPRTHLTMEDEVRAMDYDAALREYEERTSRVQPEEDAEARALAEESGRVPDDWNRMTEEERNAALDEIYGRDTRGEEGPVAAREAPRPDDDPAQVGPRGDGEGRQPGADDEPFALERPTEQGLRERADAERRAGEERARVENAPAPSDFSLTGSDRAADEARAAGQQELPGTNSPAPGGKGITLFSGPPILEMLGFAKELGERATGPMREWRDAALKMTEAAKAVAQAFGAKAKDLATGKGGAEGKGESTSGAIARALFYNVHSHIKSFGEAWNSPTIGKIADMIYSTAGKAQAGESFHEAQSARVMARMKPLTGIVEAVERLLKAGITDEQIIRQVENPQARQGEVGKLAARIAKWLAEEHAYMKEAGVDVGEVKDYFPREYDRAKIVPRKADFVADATKAYEAMGLRGDEARDAAEAFWFRAAYGSDGSPAFKASGGKESFSKARELTPAAAENLRQWRVAEIGDTLSSYLTRSTRRAEIARRFGDGWSRWEGLEREILKEAPDITPEALRELRAMTANAMGLRAQSMGVAAHTGAQYLRMWTTLATMPKAALSSIAETWMPIARANGDLTVAVNQLRNVVYENAKSLLTQALTGKRTDAQQRLMDFAEDIGALSQSPMSHLMADRWLGGDVDSKAINAATSKFFRLNLLEQMTTWQRALAVDSGRIWLRRLAKNADAGRKDAGLFLRELGVPEGREKDFAAFVRSLGDELPDAGMLTGDMGSLYRSALNRFTNQSIQNPNAATRPAWANTDWGAVVFQLQGFANAFHKNVLLRQANLMREGVKGDYTAAERAALMGGMIPGLMMSAVTAGLVWEIRDKLYNREPRERTTQAKVERAISASGLTGALDPYLQMIGGIRYQRSPAASAGGPSFGAVDAVFSSMGQLVANNSDRTNAAERKAAETFYQWGLQPAATLLLAASPAPVAPLTQAATVIGLPRGKEPFVDEVAGPKDRKKQKPIRGIFEPGK